MIDRVDPAGKRHLFGRDQVAPPDLDRVGAEMRGDGVEQAFANEGSLEPAGRAIGRGRRLVGQPDMAARPEGGNPVGAGHHAGGHVRDADAVGADIGALVVEEIAVDTADGAVGVHGCANPVALFARMVGRLQVLPAVLDPLDRPAEAERRGADQILFRVELAADAEPAADLALVELHRRGRPAERGGHLVAVEMRPLGGAVEFEHVAAGIVDRDGAPRLHRHRGVPPHRNLDFDRRVSAVERRGDVAARLLQHMRLGRMRRVESAGFVFGRKDRRQVAPGHLDELGRVLGAIGAVGEQGGDRLAHIADPGRARGCAGGRVRAP